MEGRRIFAELTVEENLRVGGHTKPRRAAARRTSSGSTSSSRCWRERRRRTAGYLSGGEQQMLAMGRALMARAALPAARRAEPRPGAAAGGADPRPDRGDQPPGTAVLLVEQNATMALSIADHGYVMETGKVVLDKPAAELLADDDVREFYLGLRRRGRRASRSATSSTTSAGSGGCHDATLSDRARDGRDAVLQFDDVHLSFAGVKAIDGVSFDGRRAASCSPSSAPTARARPRSSTCSPASTGRSRAGSPSTARTSSACAPHRDRRSWAWPRTFQNIELFANLTVLDNLMLGRHHHIAYGALSAIAWLGRARARGARHRRRGRGDRRLPRARAVAASSRSACCPTACRSASSWAARWPWSPSCCCSTSRWRA